MLTRPFHIRAEREALRRTGGPWAVRNAITNPRPVAGPLSPPAAIMGRERGVFGIVSAGGAGARPVGGRIALCRRASVITKLVAEC